MRQQHRPPLHVHDQRRIHTQHRGERVGDVDGLRQRQQLAADRELEWNGKGWGITSACLGNEH